MAEQAGKGENPKVSEKDGPQMTSLPRIIPKGLGVYYSNCALVTASHRELSVMFGRVGTADGAPGLAEVYERHIYMTVDQAIDVARAIMMTAQKFQENKQMMEANRAANAKIPQV
jgi:hypothetical protein